MYVIKCTYWYTLYYRAMFCHVVINKRTDKILMTVLALIVGADMAFVVSHHVLRIFVVILGAPLFARLFGKEETT